MSASKAQKPPASVSVSSLASASFPSLGTCCRARSLSRTDAAASPLAIALLAKVIPSGFSPSCRRGSAASNGFPWSGWTTSAGASKPAAPFRTLCARSSLPMLSCWFFGANSSHPAEGAACAPDSKLCLSLSGFENLLPAARRWPRPSAHSRIGHRLGRGNEPDPARDQFLAPGVVGALLPGAGWIRCASFLWR